MPSARVAAIEGATATSRDARPSELLSLFGCHSKHPLLMCRNHIKGESNDVVEAGIRHWRRQFANDTDFVRHSQLHRRHDTCALVGSSYNLMKHEFGDEIDAHDLVVRLNDPPVKGFENHVGRRPADISIYNLAVAKARNCAKPPRNESLMVHCSFTFTNPDVSSVKLQADARCVSETWKKYGLKTLTLSKYVLFTAERALTYMYQRAGKKKSSKTMKASCGMRSIIFLLPLCRNLHLYGFGGTEDDEPYKYYVKILTRDLYQKAAHDFVGETRFIDALASGHLNRSNFFGLPWKEIGKLVVHR
ncbi:CMP-N-acetylneuraminate-beta-galactosamide-alpha-2,3-sialyltransferase 1-like [Oscarella lobularis]|uniref:CMP-N-acetylneuraminate-beta-galactosamide- alpha-2,3-sialyltransferase 1-like n=1 Tax=Oscarella lobularis TaxID=121494 RepID=UPI0033141DB6